MQIDEHTLLQVVLIGSELRIRPVKLAEANASGSSWVRDLYEMFAPVRDEAADLSEAEVNADIDKAVQGKRDMTFMVS